MENKYFPGVKFPEPEPDEEPVPTDKSDKLECKIEEALTESQRIINAIRSGESDLHRGGLIINSNTPMMNAMERLEQNATKKNLVQFLRMVQQDTNSRVAQEIAKLFQYAYKDLQTLLIESGVL